VVREQTLKSVLTLITKLSDRTINGELLRYLAKTANDEQPGIRTNTTICLGKIAKNLGTSSRAKVLIAAFGRSLRDPFVHARNASLMALSVTGEYFSDEDCALRIIPAISPLLIDKEKVIREQASKTLDIYIQKIRKAAAAMPDSDLPPETSAAGGPRMSTPQPTESSASTATAWAGWAISSFTNKLSAAAGEIQPTSNGSQSPSLPAPSSKPRPAPSSQTASALHRQALKSPPPSAPMSRASSSGGMGGESFFPDPDVDDGDAWGDMDEAAGGDDFFGNGNETPSLSPSTTLPKKESSSRTVSGSTSAVAAFDDGSEPDFAGWLAAQQAQKKSTASGIKGLAKATPSGGGKVTPVAAKKVVPVAKAKVTAPAKKKIDMKPKATDDDDGWGDGW